MTYETTTCDICGRSKNEDAFIIMYKFKVKKERYEWKRIGCKRWAIIDVCSDCLRELRKISREKGKGEK